MKRMTTDSPQLNIERLLNTARAENNQAVLYLGDEVITLAEYVTKCAKEHGCDVTQESVMDGDDCCECDCPIAVLNVLGIQAAENNARLKMIEKILENDYDLDRLKELIEADREGRCIVLNSGYTETVGGEALRKAMYECFMTNNEVTRYTADAIAEKIVRDTEDSHIDRNKWKPCWTCENDICRTCVNAGTDPLGDPCYKCSQDDMRGQYEPANFCPNCGRPLTNEAWDMLEKRIKQNQMRGI